MTWILENPSHGFQCTPCTALGQQLAESHQRIHPTVCTRGRKEEYEFAAVTLQSEYEITKKLVLVRTFSVYAHPVTIYLNPDSYHTGITPSVADVSNV